MSGKIENIVRSIGQNDNDAEVEPRGKMARPATDVLEVDTNEDGGGLPALPGGDEGAEDQGEEAGEL